MSAVTLSRAFGIVKTPRFNTISQITAALQGSIFIAAAVYPVWDFKLTIPQLSGRVDDPTSATAQLLDLFMSSRGGAGTFLLQDPDDFLVTSFQFGTGDGVSKTFQLTRPVGTFMDICQNINGTPTIFINGTPTAAYALDSKGVVTFNVSPAAAAVLAWSGTFAFSVRFTTDSLADLTEYFADKWSIATLTLTSEIR